MQRYTVVSSGDADNQQWVIQEVVVLGSDRDSHIVAVCGNEQDARLVALALEDYWDRRQQRRPGERRA